MRTALDKFERVYRAMWKLAQRLVKREEEEVNGRWVAEDTGGIVGSCTLCGSSAAVMLSYGKLGTVGVLCPLCRICSEDHGLLPPCRDINSGAYEGDKPPVEGL